MNRNLQVDKSISPPEIPLVFTWRHPDNPLPLRIVRALGPTTSPMPGLEAPPWLVTGPVEAPFDFCGHVRRLCADVVARCPELDHIDVSRLLFTMTQARSSRRHGLQARLTPLRFHAGRLIRYRRGVAYQVQRYIVDSKEMLYLVSFCLPRFLDQEFDDKFITLFHELYHISGQFDGDLRRHPGRCTVHSNSKHAYDAHMAHLARAYLASGPNPDLHAFLRLSFTQLRHRHGSVTAIVVPRPKVIPVGHEVSGDC